MTEPDALYGEMIPLFGKPNDMTSRLLRAWCATWCEIEDREAWVAEHGSTITLRDDKGDVRSVVQAPKYVQLRGLRMDLVRLSAQLGVPALEANAQPKRGVADELRDRRNRKDWRPTTDASANA